MPPSPPDLTPLPHRAAPLETVHRAAPPPALTTRGPGAALCFGQCELRLDTREVLLDGQVQPVRRRVFDVLAYLVAQRPRAVTNKELLRAVWPRTDVSVRQVTRAVMEARCACGDNADAPQHLVTVRGVGYRFIGLVRDGSAAQDPPSAPDQAEVTQARALAQQAMDALDANALPQAEALADEALVQARWSQSNSETVRALVVRSNVAMRCGTAEDAAALASEAHRIARAEGQPALIGQARVALGYVHLLAGDRAVALRHLQAAREALTAPGYEDDLQRCLSRLCMVFRDMGNPEAGLQLCREALALARRRQQSFPVLVTRTHEVVMVMRMGDAHADAGKTSDARAAFEQALRLVDALLPDLQAAGATSQRQSVLGNRAFLLERLGRFDEAWQALALFEQALDLRSLASSPVYAERHQIYLMQRAGLLSRWGRHPEALQDLQASLDAAQKLGRKSLLPQLYGQASEMAQRAGLTDQALAYARCQVAAQTAAQAEEAQALVRLLEAEQNVDELQAQLHTWRGQANALLAENAELRQQVQALSAPPAASAGAGLAAGQATAAFAPLQLYAQARGLPMCLGLLRLVNHSALADRHAQADMDALLQRTIRLLTTQFDIGPSVVAAGPGQWVFHLREAGPVRAAQVCDGVADALATQTRLWSGLHLRPEWRCVWNDAAAHASIDACVTALVNAAGTAPAHPGARTVD